MSMKLNEAVLSFRRGKRIEIWLWGWTPSPVLRTRVVGKKDVARAKATIADEEAKIGGAESPAGKETIPILARDPFLFCQI